MGRIEKIDRPGVAGKQVLNRLPDAEGGFCARITALQEFTQAAELANLIIPLLQFLSPTGELIIGLAQLRVALSHGGFQFLALGNVKE